MPTWMFVAALALTILFGFAVQIWMLARMARLFGSTKRNCWRGVLPALVPAIIAATTLLLPRGHEPFLIIAPVVLYAAALTSGILCYMVMFDLWWPRATAGLVLGNIATAPLIVAITLGIIRPLWLKPFAYGQPDMRPGINPGEVFLVDRTAAPQRWDLIVVNSPGSPSVPWVRRVAGMPGETILIDTSGVMINGQDVQLPPELMGRRFDQGFHARGRLLRAVGAPLQLRDDEYFLIGDVPELAVDSRNFAGTQLFPMPATPGAIPSSAVVGVVRLVFSPSSLPRLLR
jgi:signal peptidase I